MIVPVKNFFSQNCKKWRFLLKCATLSETKRDQQKSNVVRQILSKCQTVVEPVIPRSVLPWSVIIIRLLFYLQSYVQLEDKEKLNNVSFVSDVDWQLGKLASSRFQFYQLSFQICTSDNRMTQSRFVILVFTPQNEELWHLINNCSCWRQENRRLDAFLAIK